MHFLDAIFVLFLVPIPRIGLTVQILDIFLKHTSAHWVSNIICYMKDMVRLGSSN